MIPPVSALSVSRPFAGAPLNSDSNVRIFPGLRGIAYAELALSIAFNLNAFICRSIAGLMHPLMR